MNGTTNEVINVEDLLLGNGNPQGTDVGPSSYANYLLGNLHVEFLLGGHRDNRGNNVVVPPTSS